MINKRDIEIANHLANEGLAFSDDLRIENQNYFDKIDCDYFAIASAIALCWTGHAKYEAGFIEYASEFIEGSIPKNPDIAPNYCKRFGVEGLDIVLSNYRAYYKRIKHLLPDFSKCSIQDINKLQQRLLSQLNNFRNTGEVTGIGPWLFLGPFKIILGDQNRFWRVDGINAIILPTGMEIDRGINRLIKEDYTFMRDFDPHWLEETTGSLLDNYATCSMVHTHINKIAEIAGAPALHINSALYLYGRNDI